MRFLSLLLAFVVSCAAADTPKTRIVLAGDSTVTDTAGWGAAFAKLFGPQAECINLAAGGRSSKSFRTEGKWKAVLDLKPAFVLIQFGHNDIPGKGPERETDPATTFPENMGRFVDEVRAAGGQPILVTSMARRVFENGKLRGELKPWADATAKVAADKKVPLVDLFARSVELLEKLGPKASDEFNPPGKDKNSTDRTAPQRQGSRGDGQARRRRAAQGRAGVGEALEIVAATLGAEGAKDRRRQQKKGDEHESKPKRATAWRLQH